MRIYLKKFGNILTSRPAGKEAYLAYQPSLSQLADKEIIEIDFEGVSVFTPSWADEFITPLINQYEDRVVLLDSHNPSVQVTLSLLKKIWDKK